MIVIFVAHEIFKMHRPLLRHLWVGLNEEIPLGTHPRTIPIEKFHTKTISILSFLMFEKYPFLENYRLHLGSLAVQLNILAVQLGSLVVQLAVWWYNLAV